MAKRIKMPQIIHKGHIILVFMIMLRTVHRLKTKV